MTVAIVDTTVIIHLFRKNADARRWLANQPAKFSVTPITWMEAMFGAINKRVQAELLRLLNGFEMVYLTSADMDWAMQQMLTYRFSRGVAVMDCFNAAVCHRLQIPVYTQNVKDYLKILSTHLVINPY